MDIRDWPLDQIMQLPDSAFGRRWPIGIANAASTIFESFDISESPLPEWCVIWEVCFGPGVETAYPWRVELSLGDQLPANIAQFLVLEPLFPAVLGIANHRSVFVSGVGSGWSMTRLKVPVHAIGRRIVGAFLSMLTGPTDCTVIVTVSSIPREVPDCLISDHLRSR